MRMQNITHETNGTIVTFFVDGKKATSVTSGNIDATIERFTTSVRMGEFYEAIKNCPEECYQNAWETLGLKGDYFLPSEDIF